MHGSAKNPLVVHVDGVFYRRMGLNGSDETPGIVPSGRTDGDETQGRGKFTSVLLVDDSKFLADILTMFFQLDGYTARAAYSGEEAVRLIEAEVPDIAFVDIDMPGMNGLELAGHIRRSSESKATVLVALSGWDEDEPKRNAMAAGFDHFLSKPVDAPAIREFMKRIEG
ncbi:MAG: response regulator [Verrucomicrobiaceae bacterium]|nr:MAG: response regulator [Verrucomicrobiaceae bacterium]